MTRLSFGLVVACLGGALGIAPQIDGALSLTPTPVVWLEAASFTMGASERDVEYAVALCRASRPVDLGSLGPVTDGACSPLRFSRELPRHQRWTAAFGIDRTEVTHERWRHCVNAGRCPPSRVPTDQPRIASAQMPVTGVTWAEARGFCEFAGGRLPTDAEWERAARGSHHRWRFPWGRQFNSRLANYGRSPRGPSGADGFRYAAPVGSFADGASPHGLLDMAGNVLEWTASAPREREVGLGADPDVYRTIRGGSWMQPPELLRVSHRAWLPRAEHRSDLGLRCAYESGGLARRGASVILRRP